MKWTKFAIIALILLVAGFALSDPKRDPWNLKRVAVISLPFRKVKVRPLPDGKSIAISLPVWNEKTKASLLKSLFSSSLNHRLHPSRTGSMSVEVYSSAADIDFSFGAKARSTFVLIGEVRKAKQIKDLLDAGNELDAIPKKIIDKVMRGRVIEAKMALRKTYKTDREKGKNARFEKLRKSRMSIFDVLGGNRQSAKCEPLSQSLKTPEDRESALLSAWCHYFKRNARRAKRVLAKLENSKPDPSIRTRALALNMKMALGEILFAGRNGNPTLAAKLIVENQDTIMKSAPNGLLLEIIGQDLMKAGLGIRFCKMIQRLMADATPVEMDQMSPVMSEAFFAVGQRVRASDSASYFLTRPQPEWIEGRLKRIRGLVHLQEGNWDAAKKDLETAKKLIGTWELDDELALRNATLFSKEPQDSTDIVKLEDIIKGVDLSQSQKQWFARVLGERELKENRIPGNATLEKLPAHVLYQAHELAVQRGQTELADSLLKLAAKDNGEWGKMARITQKTQKLRRQVEIAKRMMK